MCCVACVLPWPMLMQRPCALPNRLLTTPLPRRFLPSQGGWSGWGLIGPDDDTSSYLATNGMADGQVLGHLVL